MKTYLYESELLIDASIEKVFDFFSKAENLERLTPPQVQFKILTPTPIEMRAGALIEYQIKLMGVPFHWLTEIAVWEPQTKFVDVQLKGPYRKWEHTHSFQSQGELTLMRDRVEYAVPGFFLGPLVQSLFVGKQVEQIFQFRDQAISEIFT